MPAHRVLLAHPDFAAARHSTKWVEEELDPALFAAPTAPTSEAVDGEAEAPLVERTVPVEIEGKRFTVRVWMPEVSGGAAPSAGARRSPRPKAAGTAASGSNGMIAAPMQGTIVKVLVKEGDEVAAGQAVLVLEAMKMENHLNAERDGTVTEIRVQAGDTVGTGDVLVVIG